MEKMQSALDGSHSPISSKVVLDRHPVSHRALRLLRLSACILCCVSKSFDVNSISNPAFISLTSIRPVIVPRARFIGSFLPFCCASIATEDLGVARALGFNGGMHSIGIHWILDLLFW